MDSKTQKILLISTFALIWIVLGYLVYQRFNSMSDEFYFFESQKNKVDNIAQQENPVEEILSTEKEEPVENVELDIRADISTLEDRNSIHQNISQIEQGFFDETLADSCGEFPCYSAKEFLDIYTRFENATGKERVTSPIYNNIVADKYIRNISENRGYTQRIFADKIDIINFENIRTRVGIRDSYIKMRDAMKKENITLHFVSGYRTAGDQESIFKKKMGTVVVDDIIKGISAPPGYSKHHLGYTADFGCGSAYLVYDFATTSCYTWMSENNFENAKRFGFLPSYPNAVIDQGPNPEPWEYVWVGVENIK